MLAKMDRLTLDCIASRKAGMTYGKWKAIHPHTEVEEPEAPKTGPRKLCGICGQEIPSSYKGKLYCGVICAAEANRARNREFGKRKRERMKANGQV